MVKKILSVTTLCFVLTLQTQVNAQNLKAEANFWVKGSNAKSVVNLNGNNPISDQNQGAIMTQIGDNHSNFYIVFQSFDTHEVDLADINMKCFQNKITTQNINPQSLNVPLLEKIQSGAILKYGFNLGNYKVTDDFMLLNNEKDRTYIYEVIYMNKEFNDIDHKHLQTYLSLKYGISLIDVNNYLSHANKEIWNPNVSSEFNNHVIGLGKSNYYDLNQISSTNSVDKLLTISSNSLNNEEYVLVGNNAKSNKFVTNDSESVLEKSYLVQTTSGNEEVVTFSFNTSLLENFDSSKPVYLILNNDEKVLGKLDKNTLVFSDVVLNRYGNGIDNISLAYDFSTIKAELAEAWFLNENGQVVVKPTISADKNSDYKVSWFLNNELVSNKIDLVAVKTGVYEMRITSNNGTSSHKTNVYNRVDNALSNEISVYPNPVEIGQEFKISYNLGSESSIEVSIYQIDGKLVTNKKLGRFNQYEFITKLDTAGVYIIVSKIDGKANINKIVIK